MKKLTTQDMFRNVDLAYKINQESIFTQEKFDFSYKITETNDFVTVEKNSPWDILLDTEDKAHSYKAVAFINKETKEIHISTAGTVPTDTNDLYDDVRINFGYTPKKIESMKKFVSEAINNLGKDASEYTFSTSGHSLGAVVSDLTAAEILSRGLKFDKSTTFENPGSKKVMETAIKQNAFSGNEKISLEKISKHCEEYNARPNFINNMADHLADDINMVLPKSMKNTTDNSNVKQSQEKVKSSYSGLFGFGKYICDKVGNIANKCAEKLGITSVVKQIEEHSLKNFQDIDFTSVKIKIEGQRYEDSYGNKKAIIKESEYSKLESIEPTGNDAVLIKTDLDQETDFETVDIKYYAYKDLLNINNKDLSDNKNDYDSVVSDIPEFEIGVLGNFQMIEVM